MDPFQQHGAFSWFELMTTDPDAAKEFYAQLLGWSLEDNPMPGMPPYTIIKAGDQEVGGLMGIPPNAPSMPPAWGVYITVDNVDATAEKARTLGAQILMPPTDIETVGRFAVIQDPQGATFSLITYQAR